jgi:hypothetical protein
MTGSLFAVDFRMIRQCQSEQEPEQVKQFPQTEASVH